MLYVFFFIQPSCYITENEPFKNVLYAAFTFTVSHTLLPYAIKPQIPLLGEKMRPFKRLNLLVNP